jgi:hypothetical protein
VLGRVAGERGQVDDLAALDAFGFRLVGAALVIVVAATGAGDEREPCDESKELDAPALSSHVETSWSWSV